jgi:hypothetical protein
MAGEELKVGGYGTSLLNSHPIDGRARKTVCGELLQPEALAVINVPNLHTHSELGYCALLTEGNIYVLFYRKEFDRLGEESA